MNTRRFEDYVGTLTNEETVALARIVVQNITVSQLVVVLHDELDDDAKDEISGHFGGE